MKKDLRKGLKNEKTGLAKMRNFINFDERNGPTKRTDVTYWRNPHNNKTRAKQKRPLSKEERNLVKLKSKFQHSLTAMFRAISYMVTPTSRASDTQLPGKDLAPSPEDVENKPHITSVDKDNTAKQTAELLFNLVQF